MFYQLDCQGFFLVCQDLLLFVLVFLDGVMGFVVLALAHNQHPIMPKTNLRGP